MLRALQRESTWLLVALSTCSLLAAFGNRTCVHSQSRISEQHLCQLCCASWTQTELQSWNAQCDVLPALAWVRAAECDTNNSNPISVSALTGFWETSTILGICSFSWQKNILSLDYDLCGVMPSPPSNFCIQSWIKDHETMCITQNDSTFKCKYPDEKKADH